MKDAGVIELALGALRRAGCEGEVFLERSRSTRVVVSGGTVEALEVREDRGAGIRTFQGGRAGFSFTADLSPQGIETAVSRAVEISAVVGSDPASRLPGDPGPPAEGLRLFDASLADVPVARKIEMAMASEESARGADRRVSGVRESAYEDFTSLRRVANTSGLDTSFQRSRAVVSIELAATESGESQLGWHAEWRVGVEDLDPVAVALEAVRKATVKLGASPARTRRTAVLLTPDVTASLLGALSSLFSADAVLKGKSLMAGKVGQPVAAETVSLVDDGRHPEGYASGPVDGEGVAARETTLIEGGILLGYLQSAYTAHRMGTSLTGNALRPDYTSRPRIGPTNLHLRPSDTPPDELLRGVTEGVCVMEVMGLHTIDSASGDFSLGASGLTVESGRLSRPVDRMAIAGNIISLLSSIKVVASDLQFLIHGPGSTVLLQDMAVSGK